MAITKIRVILHSFHSPFLDEACQKIVSILQHPEKKGRLQGPVFLPTKKRIYCVLRSPHVDKDSREQFEIRRYKRILDFYPTSPQDVDIFLKIEVPAGVSIQIKHFVNGLLLKEGSQA